MSVRIAVLGAGNMGRGHGKRLEAAGARIVAVCDFRRSGKESYIQHTEIDGFGIRVTVQGRQGKVGFDKLMKVEETGKAFYLYLAANQAWLLPKDQMEDPASESAALRQIFSTVVESRRLKLKKS